MENEELELSIVMPCLNEAETLENCLKKAMQAIHSQGLKAEIIVADNGSTDNSPEIALRNHARVIRVAEKGYGSALMGGIAAAKGTFIILGDADDSYDFSQIQPFVEKLREGFDLVMGCRFPRGNGSIMPGAMPWINRWIGNPILTAIGRIFFHSPILDFHCGLRGLRREAFLKMDLRTTGMEFASEMVIKATLKEMKVTQVPITLYKDGRKRRPHLRNWRDGWRHLRFMLLFSPRWLFLIPGLTLITLGLTASLILLKGPLKIGNVGFDTNSLLISSMAILIGFQLFSFSMFAKVFAVNEGLLPSDSQFNKIFEFWTLEKGLYAGSVCFLSGIGILIWATSVWEHHGFGALSYPDSLRLVIPGVTMATLGLGVIFSSFLLSFLGLNRK